jgi:CheY-like chemotaxis protein
MGHEDSRIIWFIHPAGVERDVYVSALSAAGFTTTAEANAADAIGRIGVQELPDQVVLELLPDPDAAWAFIERMLATAPGAAVIILTSLIRPDRLNRRRARALGCAAFVAKPCSVRQLVDIVRRVDRGSRGLECSTYGDRGGPENP